MIGNLLLAYASMLVLAGAAVVLATVLVAIAPAVARFARRVRGDREARRVEGRFYGDLRAAADAVQAPPSDACERCGKPARTRFLAGDDALACWKCFDAESYARFLADPVLARDHPAAVPARCEGCRKKPAGKMAEVGGKHLCGWCACKAQIDGGVDL